MNNDFVTLRQKLTEEMQKHSESFDDVEHLAIENASWLDLPLYRTPYIPFRLWTKKRVYFQVESEYIWVLSASRNPDEKADRILIS